MPSPHWDVRILGDRLTIEGVGEWTFDDERVTFFDTAYDMIDFECPDDFYKHAVRIFSAAPCTLGVVQRGEILWQFRRTGEIVPAYRMVDRFLSLDRVEVYGDQMVYSCEVGICVFRNDQRVWNHEFRDGLQYETLEATPIGLRYETPRGDPRMHRWLDGARVP